MGRPAGNENVREPNQFIFDRVPDNELIANFMNCYNKGIQ